MADRIKTDLVRVPLGLLLVLLTARTVTAQVAFSSGLPAPSGKHSFAQIPESAWLDLRQTTNNRSIQSAPAWVESVKLDATGKTDATPAAAVFRIRVDRPVGNYHVLFVRLFFFDRGHSHPSLTAWDESGSQLIRSGPLGTGSEVDNSASVMVPMHSASTIDIESPGDGSEVRGAFLQWMTSSELVHAPDASAQESVPQPFAAATGLSTPAQDAEKFGTVTASLAAESVRIGGTSDQAALFNFELEAAPLLALVSFEIAGPRIDSPPEITVNGHGAGVASLILPGLADPGYRGEMRALTNEMRFQYTGWVRAQIVVPAGLLQTGANEIAIMNGRNASTSVIRATQIQLKYLWDKSDYILKPQP